MDKLLTIIIEAQGKYQLFTPEALTLLAVSGGKDSIALLHAMAQLKDKLQIQLHVATLDHGLRPESNEDVEFVQSLSRDLNLPFTTDHVDVMQLARTDKLGIEAAGRQARYDFLAQVATKIGATTILTGHHAGDQAETILMHIVRGSGTQGLMGMQIKSPLPGHPDLTLARPFLHVPPSMIEAYCQAHDLQPREDSTNMDTRFLRNELRLNILPMLRKINPQVDLALLRLADISHHDQDFIQTQYQQQVLPRIQFSQHHRRIMLARDYFVSLHQVLQRQFIINCVSMLGAEPAYQHVVDAISLATKAEVGAIAQFTNGVRLRVGYEMIFIENEDDPLPEGDYWLIENSYQISVPGKVEIGQWQLNVTQTPPSHSIAIVSVPRDAELRLRTRVPGDRFHPQGLQGHTKKLKDWMIDQKIPRHLRDRIPLLTVDHQIAAILLPDQWIVSSLFVPNVTSQRKLYFSVKKLL